LAPIGTSSAVAYAVGANGTAGLVSLTYCLPSFYALVILAHRHRVPAVCSLFKSKPRIGLCSREQQGV
jgi:Na+/H+-dicarboxylate symporter